MNKFPDHNESVISLKRIEGQIRGIQRMVEDRKYCVDILTQVQAAKAALSRIERNILQKHIENCVVNAVRGKSAAEKDRKLEEIFKLLKKM
ncbi:MAG: metal-sensitive transcriptional regulator [PVC group bacterium]|nr:metal-sensitive transcriptional regulator [PVC group bacterium]